jgi:hypothetical protein
MTKLGKSREFGDLDELSEIKRDHAFKLMNHIEGQIRLADTKASLIVAANAVLAGVILSSVNDFEIKSVSIVASFLLVVVSLFSSIIAVFPQIFLFRNRINQSYTVYYFRDISDFEDEEFVSVYSNLSLTEADKQLMLNVWAKSKWAKIKLRAVRVAGLCTAICVIFLGASMVKPMWDRVMKGSQAPVKTELSHNYNISSP